MSNLNKNVTIETLNEKGKGFLPEFMGVEILELKENFLTSRLAIKPYHIAPNGYLHAATVITLADTTCGYASFAHLPEGAESLTTIELKSNHLGTTTKGQSAVLLLLSILGKPLRCGMQLLQMKQLQRKLHFLDVLK